MLDEERNICVVVVLWQVLDATRGRVMTPSRVVTVYIYLSIGAHFAAWTLTGPLSYGMWQSHAAQTWRYLPTRQSKTFPHWQEGRRMWRACLTLPTNSRHNTISIRRIAITCGVIIHCRTLFHIHTLPYAIVTFDLMSNQWSVRGPGNNWTQSGLRHHPSLPAFPSVLPSSVRPPIVYKCPALHGRRNLGSRIKPFW